MADTNNLFPHIEQLLKTDKRLVNDEGDLRINLLRELANDLDIDLIKLLLSDEKTKQSFFMPVLDAFVFRQREFKDFIDYNSSNNSYSKYLGKQIGLYVGDVALADRSEVVLNFPFKDCVLEGGQRTEDGTDTYFEYDDARQDYVEKQSKRREIFYNEILARDEIDQLFAPKAFCNAKRYDKNGMHTVSTFHRNADGCITNNLIIKGNNLLALHSLYQQFAGRVKLIYIDPPYNTGSDSFAYNDTFNHSTWLTFMKNRLEIARELLREDGSIWISCDDREQAYLKILCDDIFGRENFLNDIIWNSTKSVTNTALISVSHTHNLLYFKQKTYYVEHRTLFRLKEDGEGFSNPDNDARGLWKADPFQVGGWRPNQQYEITNPNTGVVYSPNEGCSWKNDYNKFQELLADNRIVFGANGEAGPQRKRFLSEAMERGKVSKTIWDDIETTTNATQHNKRLFGRTVFSNPKPESLIERIIQLSTRESDIVLDYHLGSGTTAAVAHKMNRQYIGIEQMDYIETVTVPRLQKVIEGEQGGISQSVNWQGGGEFVYLEMAQKNERAMELISTCQSYDELVALFDVLCERYFLQYNFRINEFKRKTMHEMEFNNLPLVRQQEIFARMIDLNQLWVNADEMNDARFGLSEEDKAITNEFYKK